jgi:hypothetical protein
MVNELHFFWKIFAAHFSSINVYRNFCVTTMKFIVVVLLLPISEEFIF